MPVVKLLQDFQPGPGERVRKAGRNMMVSQETARELIEKGIAFEPDNYGHPPVTWPEIQQPVLKKKKEKETAQAPDDDNTFSN